MAFRFVLRIRMLATKKKISSPQFLSYDHQIFFGKTLDDLKGRHVFVFAILYHKIFFFTFLYPLSDFLHTNPNSSCLALIIMACRALIFLSDFYFRENFDF